MKKSREILVRELLARPEFKQWVLDPTAESNYFWSNWIKESEDARVSAHIAREIILRVSFNADRLDAEEEEDILQKIISESTTKKLIRPVNSRLWLKYAAVLALAIITGTLYLRGPGSHQSQETVETRTIVRSNPKGQKSIVRLPDGSKVHLNANSTLKYLPGFADNRYIELDGEAYFQVEEDQSNPFTVKSGQILTTALGTSFNINTKKPALEIVLVEGKVRVEEAANPGNHKFLDPQQKVIYDHTTGLSEVRDLNDLDDILWTQGTLKFDSSPLQEVVRVLEDWYGVDISLQGNIQNLKYSGKFKDEYLSNILNAMSFSLDIDYEIKDKNVLLKPK